MPSVLQVQASLLKQIIKAIDNFGKRSVNERTKNYVRNRIAILEENYNISTEKHYEGISAAKPEELEELEEIYEKVREKYLEYKTSLLDAMDKIEATASEPVSANLSTNNSRISLPKINIPTFTGAYENWRSFFDLFDALINKNTALTSVEKLHYLKSSVGGEAERLIQHLAIDSSNYKPALEILTSRYDHKRFLVNAQLNIFFGQDTLDNENASGLKKLLDTSVECRHALSNLEVPVEHWDLISIFVITKKLPLVTQQLWEEKLGTTKELPKFKQFQEFLESRFRMLEAVGFQQAADGSKLGKTQFVKAKALHIKPTPTPQFSCKVCNKGAHAIRNCNRFRKMDTTARKGVVKRIGVCENCLAYNHATQQCPSRVRCQFCQQAHHSLLHVHTQNNPHNTTHPAPSSLTTNSRNTHTHLSTTVEAFQPSQQIGNYLATHEAQTVLLATTLIKVKTAHNSDIVLRGLVDPGSEASFITEKVAKLLGFTPRKTCVEISGLGKVRSGASHGYIQITLGALHSGYETSTRVLIFKSLTGLLPAYELKQEQWSHIQNLPLADPNFHKPAEIDLLLGAEVYGEIVLPEIIRSEEAMAPVAQNTLLGWVLMGRVQRSTQSVQSFHQAIDVGRQLQRFWEIEEVPFKAHQTAEEQECEKLFTISTKRLSSGRYEVALPFKERDRPALGSSKQGALRRFVQLERRFQHNPTLRDEYKKCLDEYSLLGHMVEVDANDEVLRTPHHFFLPHHAVIKESSSTTKLRVVFDAAAKSSDGTSLNQHLMTGPKKQSDMLDIVLKWRRHKYTFTADIEKMYRQIRVNSEDSYYQVILWRNRVTEPIKMYRLQTVTFGTTCAPYLAIRTLNQLANDEQNKFPLGARIVREDVHVDDIFTGADTIQEAIDRRNEVYRLLSSGGFNLRKWASNAAEIIEQIPAEDREVNISIPLNGSEHIKALGIKWFPVGDSFSFENIPADTAEPTKRNILSLQMQKEWNTFKDELAHLENIRIPRWIHCSNTQAKLELHGFSDASEKAYGAAIYLRVLDSEQKIHVHLLLSKTRVAPVKTQTLPRLELCAAVMLATLLAYTRKVLNWQAVKQYAWTDSTITLSWIAAPPTRWATFVSHRVAEIQRLVEAECWRHIPSELNPADLASRGIRPSALISNTLWWKGPDFLHDSWEFRSPQQPTSLGTEEEKRSIKSHTVTRLSNDILTLICEQSSLTKLIRIIGYCRRFIHNTKHSPNSRIHNVLSPTELQDAAMVLIKLVQDDVFTPMNRANVPKSLCAFSDSNGILRVGGRLQQSELSFEQRHPIIIPGSHHFTRLLITDAHWKTFHGGVQQTSAYLRNRFWILKFKRSVKSVIHKCIICFRYRAKTEKQFMGNLPAPRIRISQPFTHAGVDYAGPIEIKSWRGRGAKTLKAYFAIFICLATKAIHLELVSDLSTQAFIAALRRFISRRGICSHLYSDNGMNFVGANKQLKRMLADADFGWKNAVEILANEGIEWHFIPPASPHFGGLWEAGVKSVKYHLKRVIGEEKYTFEELTTFLNQVEACLNSRPLCPMTENPSDFSVLTPGHFLIGRALNAIPEENTTEARNGPLQRWQQIQRLQQIFWKRWTSEYLTRLQQRPKWLKVKHQPQVGDLVLVKDDNLPPAKWNLARIVALHPGKDELVRVVTLRTANGHVKRPITKICVLPSNDTYEQHTSPHNNKKHL